MSQQQNYANLRKIVSGDIIVKCKYTPPQCLLVYESIAHLIDLQVVSAMTFDVCPLTKRQAMTSKCVHGHFINEEQ